ncbi:MAG: agmatinase [Pirellulales bacterium]
MSDTPNFLQSEYPPSDPHGALFHVFPVPLERTVSYGRGTAHGPIAILNASSQLEAYDGISFPGEAGIYTAPPIDCSGEPQAILGRIEEIVRPAFQQNKVPVLLGGEHTLTQAAVRAARSVKDDVGVVQFDAHADLRNVYEGSPLSHACVMRRIAEQDIPIFQIGVRSICQEEIDYRDAKGIRFLDAVDLQRKPVPEQILPDDFPGNIYLTFDVDGLDSSLMPATGTPEPGGLFWWQALTLVASVVRSGRKVIGLDVVELAPIAGMHAPDYLAAKLTYALMGFAGR